MAPEFLAPGVRCFFGGLSPYQYRGIGKKMRRRNICPTFRGLRDRPLREYGFDKFGVVLAELRRNSGKLRIDRHVGTSGGRDVEIAQCR